MVAVPRRPLVALLFAALVSTSIILLLHTPPRWQSFADRFGVETFLPPDHRYQLDLGFISSSYVVSLPHRQDRQSDIVKLMHLMDFHNWEFFDGVYANTSLVKNLMRHVVAERANVDWADGGDWMRMSFEWPIDAAETYSPPDSDYSSTLASGGAELWPAHELPEIEIPPMMCSEDDFNLQKYRTDVPQWRFLTPERVATYHSHLTLLRRIVDDAARRGVDVRRNPDWQQQDITLVMEDDVDMEVCRLDNNLLRHTDVVPRLILRLEWLNSYLCFPMIGTSSTSGSVGAQVCLVVSLPLELRLSSPHRNTTPTSRWAIPETNKEPSSSIRHTPLYTRNGLFARRRHAHSRTSTPSTLRVQSIC